MLETLNMLNIREPGSKLVVLKHNLQGILPLAVYYGRKLEGKKELKLKTNSFSCSKPRMLMVNEMFYFYMYCEQNTAILQCIDTSHFFSVEHFSTPEFS